MNYLFASMILAKKTMNTADLLNLGLSNKYITKFENLSGAIAAKNINLKCEHNNKQKEEIAEEEQKIQINENKIFSQLCSHDYSAGQCKTLTCNHVFCLTCLTNYCKEFLSSDSIICPKEFCSKEINYFLLKEILPLEDFNKYEEFNMFKKIETQNNEKIVECPQCKIFFLVWENADFFNCEKCKEKFCVKCLCNWKYHQNKICKVDKNSKETSEKNSKLSADLLNNDKKFKKCPVRHVLIEKIGACNYMQCCSEICQKKTIFCFLCGIALNKYNIQDHYIEKNFYETCVNSINNEKINEAEKKDKDNKKIIEKKIRNSNTSHSYDFTKFMAGKGKEKTEKYCHHHNKREKVDKEKSFCLECEAIICSNCFVNLQTVQEEIHVCDKKNFSLNIFASCTGRNKNKIVLNYNNLHK